MRSYGDVMGSYSDVTTSYRGVFVTPLLAFWPQKSAAKFVRRL
jgi:hypothetical protein